jgi:hypothetical protein
MVVSPWDLQERNRLRGELEERGRGGERRKRRREKKGGKGKRRTGRGRQAYSFLPY